MFAFLSKLFTWPRRVAPVPPPSSKPPALMMATEEVPDEADDLLVLRQSVLARDKKVAGYRYAFAGDDGADSSRHDRFILSFLASVMADASLGKRRAFADIPARLLFDPALEGLAKAGLIALIRIDADDDNVGRIAARMQDMGSAGLRLGLADARMALAHPALGACASLGFLPVDQILPPDLLQLARKLPAQHPKLRLCASGVDTLEDFTVCRRLQMHGFIGSFVTQRRDWPNTVADPGTLRLCRVVNSLRAGAEMDAIIRDIKLDPLLSYRILCHANSAGIGARSKVLALKDAVLLIGREPLFRWLVLLLCASAPAQAENDALLECALVRGRMMEMLAQQTSGSSDDCFLTGVLSLLDVILHLPVSTMLSALDPPEEIRAALLDATGPYADLLHLTEGSEAASDRDLGALCARVGVDAAKLKRIQLEAQAWARGQVQGDDGSIAFDGALPDVDAFHDVPLMMEQHGATDASEDPLAAFNRDLEGAQNGDAGAQRAMGARYASGDQVERDLARSLEWYTKAAEQGDVVAQWNAAGMYAHDAGDAGQDMQQAILWYQKAADQGFAPAQATLGRMYAAGQSVARDVGLALSLLQKAAIQGDIEAQYNLAILYRDDPSTEQSRDQAFVWLSRAAEQGSTAALEQLGLMCAVGQTVEQDLTEACK